MPRLDFDCAMKARPNRAARLEHEKWLAQARPEISIELNEIESSHNSKRSVRYCESGIHRNERGYRSTQSNHLFDIDHFRSSYSFGCIVRSSVLPQSTTQHLSLHRTRAVWAAHSSTHAKVRQSTSACVSVALVLQPPLQQLRPRELRVQVLCGVVDG